MELASGQDQLTSEGIYTVEKIRQILAETISNSAKSAGNAWFGFALFGDVGYNFDIECERKL